MQSNAIPAGGENLKAIRNEIDKTDDSIADLLAKRMYFAKKLKIEKLRLNLPLIDEQRQKEVVKKWRERARKKSRGGSESVSDSDSDRGYDLSEEMMENIARLIIEYTVKNETEG